MRSLVSLAPFVLVAVACGAPSMDAASSSADDSTSSATADMEPKAGSRLTPMGYRLDGRAVLSYFADATTGQSCTLESGSGWATPMQDVRCLPRLSAVSVYLDGNCTQQGAVVAAAGDWKDARKFATLAYGQSVVALGQKRAAGATVYNLDGEGHCNVETTWSGFPDEIYEAAPAPITTFVTGTVVAINGDASFARNRWTGTDGSSADTTLTEKESGELCGVRVLGDGSYRCLPVLTASIDSRQFADAQCTQPTTVLSTSANASTKTIESGASRCAPVFHQVGPFLPATYDKLDNGSCAPRAQNPNYAFATIAAEIPLSSFPTFTAKRGAGAGVTSATMTAAAGGMNQPILHDGTGGCWPQRMADGQMACVPYDISYASAFFGDAGCTAHVVASPTCTSNAAMIPNGLSGTPGKITGAHQGAIYARNSSGACTVQTNGGPAFDVVPATFPALPEPTAIVPVVVTPPAPTATTPPAPTYTAPAPTYTAPAPTHQPSPVASGAGDAGVFTSPTTVRAPTPATTTAPVREPATTPTAVETPAVQSAPSSSSSSCAMTHGSSGSRGSGAGLLVVAALVGLASRRRRSYTDAR